MNSNNVNYYFDVTDVVNHSLSNGGLTGIQRVVLGVLKDTLSKLPKNTFCVAHSLNLKDSHTIVFKPEAIFSGNEDGPLDSVFNKLRNLGNRRAVFKIELKTYLLPYKNKIEKKLRELLVKFLFRFYPSVLQKHGFSSYVYCRQKQINYSKFSCNINTQDKIVFLGLQLEQTPITKMAYNHRMQGGDVIQLVHDLIAHIHPHFFKSDHSLLFDKWLNRAVKSTSKFICVSHSTRKDLANFCEKKGIEPIIEVVHLSHEFKGIQRNTAVTNNKLEYNFNFKKGDFVLCVGTIEIRKNGTSLIKTWTTLQNKLADNIPTLVFVGSKGWLTDEFERLLINYLNRAMPKRIVWLSNITDQELGWLYSNCIFTLYPSFYEGWGLPIGEAAWFGKYTISSNRSSMPEVCGHLIDYINPEDQEELTSRVEHVLRNPNYISEKETEIRRAPLRTWEDVTQEIINHLK